MTTWEDRQPSEHGGIHTPTSWQVTKWEEGGELWCLSYTPFAGVLKIDFESEWSRRRGYPDPAASTPACPASSWHRPHLNLQVWVRRSCSFYSIMLRIEPKSAFKILTYFFSFTFYYFLMKMAALLMLNKYVFGWMNAVSFMKTMSYHLIYKLHLLNLILCFWKARTEPQDTPQFQ